VVSSKLGTQIQKPASTSDRETSGKRAAGGAARASQVLPQKWGKCRVFAAILWSRAPRFDARLRALPLVPLSPINTPFVV